MIKKNIIYSIIVIAFLAIGKPLTGQQNYTLVLDRGRLWHAFDYAQECEPLSDWQRKTFGLDWPGFNTEELSSNIGGSNSYLVSGGFYITALDDTGTVWGWDDFAINARGRTEWSGDFYRYLAREHRLRWPNGENYWLATDPFEAEEVIDSEWEENLAWFEPTDNNNIPVIMRRTVRQWAGSQADEDYIIIEYVIKNKRGEFIGRDFVNLPLDGVYLLFSYALSPNHRGWRLTFPNLPQGARNTTSSWDPVGRTLTAWAGDLTSTPSEDESYDFYNNTRYDPFEDRFFFEPEYLATGVMGIKFLHISADSTGQENRINGFSWSAASPSNDHSGPFLGVAGLDNKYTAMADPLQLSEAFDSPDDVRLGDNRLYANFSLGPFYMQPEDSVRIVIAEYVGGLPYEKAIQPQTTREMIRAAGDSAVQYLNERIQFNYDHGYTVPMPPKPPSFQIFPIDTAAQVANIIQFSDSSESIPDPHQGMVDIAGYRIYRSNNFPFGPWEEIADITVGDPEYYDAQAYAYSFKDDRVALGYEYYYSVTAYDGGHASWAVDNAVAVPPLESSIFANRKKGTFVTTLKPTKNTLEAVNIVPNPFYRNSGLLREGRENRIQFVNLPEKCTIRIYTVRGDLVKTIHHHDPNSGINFWNQISDFGQLVKSGMYFYHIENDRGDEKRGKFTIVK